MNTELAQARLERKRGAATLRREIRVAMKVLRALIAELGKPKADVWSLASRIEAKAMELKVLQKSLNSIVNHGDEVSILKRAAKHVPSFPSAVVQCGHCPHGAHVGTCDQEVSYSTGKGLFVEPCGCNQ